MVGTTQYYKFAIGNLLLGWHQQDSDNNEAKNIKNNDDIGPKDDDQKRMT